MHNKTKPKAATVCCERQQTQNVGMGESKGTTSFVCERENTSRGGQETGNLSPWRCSELCWTGPEYCHLSWGWFYDKWYCFEGWGWTNCFSEVPLQLKYSVSLWWINICMQNCSVILIEKKITGVEWKEMDLDIYAFRLIRELSVWLCGLWASHTVNLALEFRELDKNAYEIKCCFNINSLWSWIQNVAVVLMH